MFQKHSVKVPKNKSKIIIYQNNLTNEDACSLEKSYIKLYGRKDIGTGILRNQTDGGDGGDTSKSQGYKRAKEHGRFNGHIYKSKEILIKANKKRSDTLMNHIVSEETKMKISKTRKEKNIPSPNKGKKLSDETKTKLKIPKEKYICTHCKKIIGGKTNFIRWHNDNCKVKD
jgi:hypothetical protein